ncbi:hypothetical protein TNCV_831671 [Trichonephila clavipes]|nr:hypothetical protein TNCV_831671 [Trichonephila clavipes]
MIFCDFKAGLNQEECVQWLKLAFDDESPRRAFVFRCRALVKAIKLEGQKIVTANWYTAKCLPEILQKVNVNASLTNQDTKTNQSVI